MVEEVRLQLPIFKEAEEKSIPLDKIDAAPSYQEYINDPDWVLNDPRN